MAPTAVAWATLSPSEPQRHDRLQTVQRVARCMHAEAPRHETPPAGVCRGRRQRPTPSILREEALQQLLVPASRLGPPGALRPQTYRTLGGLLAVTGMRVSAARALPRTEGTDDGRLIRHTKCKKSRFLPVAVTTRAALDRSLCQRRRVAGLDPHLFVTRRGAPLSRTVVPQTFHHVLEAAGIPRAPGRRHPRRIDLRHPFAVRALEASPETREAIGRQTLALTPSMGPTCVAST